MEHKKPGKYERKIILVSDTRVSMIMLKAKSSLGRTGFAMRLILDMPEADDPDCLEHLLLINRIREESAGDAARIVEGVSR